MDELSEQAGFNVSAIVATKNSARTLRACLQSIRDQTLKDVEIVVVDNNSTDGSVEIARSLANRVITAGPERSAQRNIGIRSAAGKYVCVLDSDMTLQPGVLESAFELAEKGAVAVALPERSFGRGFWARCKEAERRCYESDETTSAARFFSKERALSTGLYDESLTGPEDWDLSMRILGPSKMVFSDHLVLHDEGHPQLFELFRKRRYYGSGYARFIRKHGWAAAKKMMPARGSLLSKLPQLFKDPIVGIGVFILKGTEAAGVLTGTIFGPGGSSRAMYKPGESNKATRSPR